MATFRVKAVYVELGKPVFTDITFSYGAVGEMFNAAEHLVGIEMPNIELQDIIEAVLERPEFERVS